MTGPAPRLRCPTLVALAIAAGVLCLPTPAQGAAAAPAQQPVSESAARTAAAASGQAVEVTSRTTETEQSFAEADGTFTLRQSAVPVRVRRGSGWVPVDTTLVRIARLRERLHPLRAWNAAMVNSPRWLDTSDGCKPCG